MKSLKGIWLIPLLILAIFVTSCNDKEDDPINNIVDSNFENLIEEITTMNKNLDNSLNTLNSLDFSAEDISQKLTILDGEISTYTSSVANIKAEINSLKDADNKAEANTLFVAIQNKLNELKDKFVFAEANFDAKTDISIVDSNLEQLSEEISSTDIASLTNQQLVNLISSWNSSKDGNKTDIDSIDVVVTDYKTKALTEEYSVYVTEFTSRETELKTEKIDLATINSDIQSIIDQFGDNVEFLVLAYEKDVNTIVAKVNTLKTTLVNTNSLVDAVALAITNATTLAELTALDTDISAIGDSISKIKTLKTEYNSGFSGLDSQYDAILPLITSDDANYNKFVNSKSKADAAEVELGNVSTNVLTSEKEDLISQKNTKYDSISDENIKASVQASIDETNATIVLKRSDIDGISADIDSLKTLVDAGTIVDTTFVKGVKTRISNVDLSSIQPSINDINSAIAGIVDATIKADLTTKSEKLKTLLNGLNTDLSALTPAIDYVKTKNDKLIAAVTPTVYYITDLVSADFAGTEITIDANHASVDITTQAELDNFLSKLAIVNINKADVTLQTTINVNGLVFNGGDFTSLQNENVDHSLNVRLNLANCSGSGNVTISELRSLLDFETPNGPYYDGPVLVQAPFLDINPNNNYYTGLNINFEGETLELGSGGDDIAYVVYNIGKTNVPYNGTLTGSLNVDASEAVDHNPYDNTNSRDIISSNVFNSMANVSISNLELTGSGNFGDYAKSITAFGVKDEIANMSIVAAIDNASLLFMLNEDGSFREGMTEVWKMAQRDGVGTILNFGITTENCIIPEMEGKTVLLTTQAINELLSFGFRFAGAHQTIIYDKDGTAPTLDITLGSTSSGGASITSSYITVDINSSNLLDVDGSYLGGDVIAGADYGNTTVYTVPTNSYTGLSGTGLRKDVTLDTYSEIVNSTRVIKNNLVGMADISTGRLPSDKSKMTDGWVLPGGVVFTNSSNTPIYP